MARLVTCILLPLAAAFTRPTRSVRHPAQPLHAVDPVVAVAAVAAVPTGYFFYTMQQEKDAADTNGVVAAPTPAPAPAPAPALPAFFAPKKKTPAATMAKAAWSGDAFGAAAVAQQRADGAAASAKRKAKLAKRGIKPRPAAAFERAAWSGSCYDSPTRATAAKAGFFAGLLGRFRRKRKADAAPAKAAKAAPAGPPTAAAWRAACDASGVTSYADFGVKLAA
ncbi:hypothetical protein SO694_00079182 [Aureococcus anophagefferens]|uniref:Uncharacterized protein n=1 Tax=Aureococcus anophagefferens TaxID=44056 RepID=A0ABR1FGX2_AURAN